MIFNLQDIHQLKIIEFLNPWISKVDSWEIFGMFSTKLYDAGMKNSPRNAIDNVNGGGRWTIENISLRS